MKTNVFKKLTPVMVFLLGIFGAFGTMSMQKNTNEKAPATGWVHDTMGNPCNRTVSCADEGTALCRITYPLGEIAEQKVGSSCVQPLFRP